MQSTTMSLTRQPLASTSPPRIVHMSSNRFRRARRRRVLARLAFDACRGARRRRVLARPALGAAITVWTRVSAEQRFVVC